VKTYRVKNGEQADIEAELPPREVPLSHRRDDKRLYHAENALRRRHKDLIQTLLKHRSLCCQLPTHNYIYKLVNVLINCN